MTTLAVADLAQALEQAIKPGYAITRSRRAWFLRHWDSYIDRNGKPVMDWLTVDSDHSLSALLGRLENTRG